MVASTQYNDFVGTSAADISDHTDLTKFLKEKGVAVQRYKPVGASFYSGESFFMASILCTDEQASVDGKLVKILLDEDVTIKNFLIYSRDWMWFFLEIM